MSDLMPFAGQIQDDTKGPITFKDSTDNVIVSGSVGDMKALIESGRLVWDDETESYYYKLK